MVVQGLVDRSEHGFGDCSALLDIVRPISEHLRLNNRDEPVLLAYDRVPGQPLGVVLDGELGWLGGPDLQDSTPLGEPGTDLVVLGAAGTEGVKPLGGGLPIGARELDDALVNLDTRDHAILLEDLDEGLPGRGLLVQGLLEEDHPREALEGTWGGQEELPEGLAVGLNILDIDAGQALPNGPRALIRREDALARRGNVLGGLDQLICTQTTENNIPTLNIHIEYATLYVRKSVKL